MIKNELINDLGTDTLTGIAEVALAGATVDASPCTGTTKNELINDRGTDTLTGIAEVALSCAVVNANPCRAGVVAEGAGHLGGCWKRKGKKMKKTATNEHTAEEQALLLL